MTTTEALASLPLEWPQQPIIVTKQCSHSWLAWIGEDPANTESGLTEEEAVGKIHLRFQGVFGPVQRMGE